MQTEDVDLSRTHSPAHTCRRRPPPPHSNQTEIVQTYVTYLRNATSRFLSLGAKVIISSPTPTNPYEATGAYDWAPTTYSWYSWLAAESLGGPGGGGVYYVDHGGYGAQALRLMGRAAADAGFPMDNTHTAPWLADVLAGAFVLGVKCGTAPLQGFVVNATSRIEGPLLGSCERANATLPIRRRGRGVSGGGALVKDLEGLVRDHFA